MVQSLHLLPFHYYNIVIYVPRFKFSNFGLLSMIKNRESLAYSPLTSQAIATFDSSTVIMTQQIEEVWERPPNWQCQNKPGLFKYQIKHPFIRDEYYWPQCGL